MGIENIAQQYLYQTESPNLQVSTPKRFAVNSGSLALPAGAQTQFTLNQTLESFGIDSGILIDEVKFLINLTTNATLANSPTLVSMVAALVAGAGFLEPIEQVVSTQLTITQSGIMVVLVQPPGSYLYRFRDYSLGTAQLGSAVPLPAVFTLRFNLSINNPSAGALAATVEYWVKYRRVDGISNEG